eukprot:1374191-Pyramimonas_sp.AAC.1
MLAKSGAPVPATTDIYNKYVLTVMGYLQQLHPTPKGLLARESWALRKVWHLPPQCLSRADIFSLASWSHIRPMSTLPRGAATLMRSAEDTVTNLRFLIEWLQEEVCSHASLFDIGRGWLSPPFWKLRPTVQHLDRAAHDFDRRPPPGAQT